MLEVKELRIMNDELRILNDELRIEVGNHERMVGTRVRPVRLARVFWPLRWHFLSEFGR